MPSLHYEDYRDIDSHDLGLPETFWKLFYTAIMTWWFFFAIDWAINGSRFTMQQTSEQAGQHLFFVLEMFLSLVIALGIIAYMDSGNKEDWKDG